VNDWFDCLNGTALVLWSAESDKLLIGRKFNSRKIRTAFFNGPMSEQPRYHSYPIWCPRFWHGMLLGDVLRLFLKNRMRIHPTLIPMAGAVTFFSAFNSLAYRVQRTIFDRRIFATPIDQPPVFIIGHWRSGTTHMHELLAHDDRFAYPTTYECFAPSHFLLTEWYMARWTGFLIPSQRPMDNMAAGWNRPQEDEFAICNLGGPSPYLRLAFPNHPPVHMGTLDMEDIDKSDLERWQAALDYFVRALTFQKRKRLILKSPTHTGRVAVLAKMYPGAKFVHISRNPYDVFASTVRLWKSLEQVQAFQTPRHDDLEEYVFTCLERMYEGFHRQREQLNPSQICDIRYEQLAQDPIGQIQLVYKHLELGDFEPVRPKLEAYVKSQSGYQTNRHEIGPDLSRRIADRWSNYIERYGYSEIGSLS